jgi:hypothetical protein
MTWVKHLLGFLFLVVSFSFANAMERAYGFCEQGAGVVTTNTALSTTKVQSSYPSCTITIYQAGTLTLAPIYSDNHGTVLGNPFTASNVGFWNFYGFGRVDIRLSNGGLVSPYVIGDVKLLDIVYVTDFGALCDGTTDDTSAIQTGIVATSASATTLNLPQATCLMSSISLRTNTHIAGQGIGMSVLKQKAGTGVSNTPMFVGTSNQNIFLERFTVDGNLTNQSATNVNGFTLISVSQIVFDKMSFINILGAPIY